MIYLTADWHIGEASTPNTHSFLRPRPTAVMVPEWLQMCHDKLTPDDTLVFLGDTGITLTDVDVLGHLPPCRKILILGDKETNSKYFTTRTLVRRVSALHMFDDVFESRVMLIAGREWYLAHKPSDCVKRCTTEAVMPALCGHVHGIWRSQKMPTGQPIINVGIDAWGGLVSETFIAHQYDAITKYYDNEAFPATWE
jgi:calcineurin-like phosphoesterase family protein